MTFQKKNRILLLAATLFLLACYFLAFSKTWKRYAEVAEMSKKVENIEQLPLILAQKKAELEQLNSELGYIGTSGKLSQDQILDYVHSFCQNKTSFIKKVSSSIQVQQGGYAIETNVLDIQGSFLELVELMYSIEQTERISRIASVSCTIHQDYRTRKKHLVSTLYLENINIE